ncbi:hypothetical protein NL676_024740 [Syzygium grande]|nr:hypothetical protein NL676_024740 [Syzygium grande]
MEIDYLGLGSQIARDFDTSCRFCTKLCSEGNTADLFLNKLKCPHSGSWFTFCFYWETTGSQGGGVFCLLLEEIAL